jgi:copper chaperone
MESATFAGVRNPAQASIIACMVTTAKIEGMSCGHCVRAVFTALAGVPGVARADVSIGRAAIEHDGTVNPEALREAISIAGYEVTEFTDDRRTLPVV